MELSGTSKRRLGLVGLIIVLGLLVIGAAGCPSGEETTTTEEQETTTTGAKAEAPEVVKDKCSLCHGLKDIEGNEITPAGRGEAGQPSLKGQFFPANPRPDWTDTINRMINTNKCPMTPAEAEETIKFFNENYKS